MSSLSAALQATKGRLDALEQMRIPTLEERLQEVSRTSAQVVIVSTLFRHCPAWLSLQPYVSRAIKV